MTINPSGIAADLRTLGALLYAENICSDVKPLEDAATECLRSPADDWMYTISGLVMYVGGDGVKCNPTHLRKVECRLDVRVGGKCTPMSATDDPLFRHSVQIVLRAQDTSSGGKAYQQTWHFDRQPNRAPPICAHPRYHFQFGGHALDKLLVKSNVTQYTNLLLLDSPRMAHAPFDGILAIDFILSNLCGQTWGKLRKHVDYVRVVGDAQRRIWRPYVEALSGYMNQGSPTWSGPDIWPQLH